MENKQNGENENKTRSIQAVKFSESEKQSPKNAGKLPRANQNGRMTRQNRSRRKRRSGRFFAR